MHGPLNVKQFEVLRELAAEEEKQEDTAGSSIQL
jgi:hypothetical protein